MMGIFMTAMAVVMLLSGAGIDRLNNLKAKNQQAQPAQITYVSESAGTSNEPTQSNVDEPTPEAMPEVDVAEHNDESAHVTEEKSSPAAPETEQDKLSEATEFWRNRLKVDRTGWLMRFDDDNTARHCKRLCDQTALLAGYDEAVALCGARDATDPRGDYYTYEKCAAPSTVAITKAAAIDRIDAEIASFAPVLAETVEVNNGERYDSALAFDVFKDEMKSRAKNSGWDLSSFLDAHMNGAYNEVTICRDSGCPYECDFCHTKFRYDQTEGAGQHLAVALDYMTAVSRITGSCYWINDAAHSFDDTAIPFCEVNKNFPGCQQFFDRLAECAAKKR